MIINQRLVLEEDEINTRGKKSLILLICICYYASSIVSCYFRAEFSLDEILNDVTIYNPSQDY